LKEQKIHIDVNLSVLRGELQRALQRNIYLVAGGMVSSAETNEFNLRLPDASLEAIFDSSLVWSVDEVRKNLCDWILQNGFRDSVECLTSFLESAHQVCSIWELALKQAEGITIKGAHWQQVMVTHKKQFHKLGFPDKLNHIENEHGMHVEPKLLQHILSINVARNCLVHRFGVVGEKDVDNGKLIVGWRRMKLTTINESGEQEAVIGTFIEKGGTIEIKSVDEEKVFNIGNKISFTPKEFQHISWCLFLFGNALVEKMSRWGTSNGFLKSVALSA
jgi:hypothetical protein